jgi:plasmid stability protein
MRTTVTLADDVAAAVAQRRARTGAGVSEVINELVRAGLVSTPERRPFVQRTARLGVRVDVSNVWEALELAERDESEAP